MSEPTDPNGAEWPAEPRIKYVRFSMLPELTPEQLADANALAEKLQQNLRETIAGELFEPMTSRTVPLTIEELDRIVRELRMAYPPEEELGCLIVDPWMEGEPMILTHEATELWIRMLFGDSAEQIITFRKRHLPRQTVVTSRETWERFRLSLLKEATMTEDLSSIFKPSRSLASWPSSFGGAPVYTIEEPPLHRRYLTEFAFEGPSFFLPHNPSLLLRKMEEYRAAHPDKPETDR